MVLHSRSRRHRYGHYGHGHSTFGLAMATIGFGHSTFCTTRTQALVLHQTVLTLRFGIIMSPLGDIYVFASWQNRHFGGGFSALAPYTGVGPI